MSKAHHLRESYDSAASLSICLHICIFVLISLIVFYTFRTNEVWQTTPRTTHPLYRLWTLPFLFYHQRDHLIDNIPQILAQNWHENRHGICRILRSIDFIFNINEWLITGKNLKWKNILKCWAHDVEEEYNDRRLTIWRNRMMIASVWNYKVNKKKHH